MEFEKQLEEWMKLDYVLPEDLPNIELYMDQVTTFMEEQLASSKRYPEDKILTKTMINNYAKNNLLPSPEKKRYSREHLLLLIFIYYFMMKSADLLCKSLLSHVWRVPSSKFLSCKHERLLTF